jgi:hypothetical protein
VRRNTVATVSYVGSKGTHLTLQRDINQIFSLPVSQDPYGPGQPLDCTLTLTGRPAINQSVACGGNPDPLRPFTGFGNITAFEDGANSIYNALQISVRHNVGRLTYSLAYTYSHSIDDSSDRYDTRFVDSYNIAGSRASSNFDQRHLLNFGYVYDIPFPATNRLMHAALGGWQFSGVTTFETGTPFDVSNGVNGDNAGVGNGVGTGSRPDVAGNPNAAPFVINTPGVIGPTLYNPGAFVAPRGLTFGDVGRNFLYNPSRTNFDLGLFKHFQIKERTSLEFRAESFNIFNHTQWNGINASAGCYGGANNSAGDPSCVNASGNSFLHPSGAHNPRILQFGFKFVF